ncbi:hypothetical protein QJS10_CPA05g00819 [Acorus calamus]|uniref:Non-specific phospholipase C2 n=1 Tax=Acorus calamus TaxID=4465 RepID=A0AAV9EUZ6_ACOCL|nr:hypothetical protein QJS10_CPA05g00819 [Acorus calamus]
MAAMLHHHHHLLLLLLLTSSAAAAPTGPIKTIVVLVMENRSFDHMLGWMKRLNPSINGVDGSESNPISAPNVPSRVHFGDGAHYVDPDPGHSFQAIREQVFGPGNDTGLDPAPMDGFAQQAYDQGGTEMAMDVMNGFRPEMVAVYEALVGEFAVCDRWFASVPSSTQPNRMFVHSGTSHGATSNDRGMLAKGYPQRTIFENIHDEGLSFGIYYQDLPAVLFYRNLRKLKFINKFHAYDHTFKDHAANGNLPNYAVIEQHYLDSKNKPANDDHPSHDVYQGQLFIKEVYETLRSSPQWNETLLVITYDEHGVVHGPNGVPFLTSEFEHSSIPATVKKLFNLSSPYLTNRDAWAGTFEGVLQRRTEPRTDCPVQLPTPVKIRQGEANEDAKLSEFQQELMQLAAALNGDHLLTGLYERITKHMTVREGIAYMENSVKRFFEAGFSAKRMGVDEEQIVKMRPSLTTRTSPSIEHP